MVRKVDVISAMATDLRSHSLLDSLFYYTYQRHYVGYMVLDRRTKSLMAVDCGDFAACREQVELLRKQQQATLTHLFLTHEHEGHSRGYQEWRRESPDLQIYASAESRLPGTTPLHEGQITHIGDLCVFPLHTPGHSAGSMSYAVTEVTADSTKTPVLFCGDALGVAGCGPVQDPKGMYESMRKLKSLPNETLVFPGHDYALESLTFAQMLEGENEFLSKKLEWAKERRAKKELAIGTVIGEERLYNPFLRCALPHFLQLTSESDPARCLAKLRKLMDELKPNAQSRNANRPQ